MYRRYSIVDRPTILAALAQTERFEESRHILRHIEPDSHKSLEVLN